MWNLGEETVWLILWVGWAIHDYYFGRWRMILGWVLSPVVIAIIILVRKVQGAAFRSHYLLPRLELLQLRVSRLRSADCSMSGFWSRALHQKRNASPPWIRKSIASPFNPCAA